MRVVGLDLSLAATGVATDAGAAYRLRPSTTGMARLRWMRSMVLDAAHTNVEAYHRFGCEAPSDCDHVDLVVIEGYSFGSRDSQAHALGELGGVVRLALWEAGIPFADVPPASLKKYSTGRGNAPKAEVLTAAVKRLDYQGHDDNEADALWLRAMALDRYGVPVVTVPAEHRLALAKVAWPELMLPDGGREEGVA